MSFPPAARDFLDAGEIDEFDIHVIPTLIGEGIPLMAPRYRDVPLRLRSARKYPASSDSASSPEELLRMPIVQRLRVGRCRAAHLRRTKSDHKSSRTCSWIWAPGSSN